RLVVAAVLQADAGVPAEGHEIGEQEAVGGLDLVLLVPDRLRAPRAAGMPDERERHVQPAPIVAAPAPLLCARTLYLGGLAVVEEEARIAFERAKVRVVREDE